MNITPIYDRGNGNADFAAENESTIEGEQGEKIPPRPWAHRIKGQQEFIRFQRSTRARSERLAAVRTYDDMLDTLAIRSRNYTNDSNATPPIGERRAQQPPALALTAVSEPRASTSSTNAVIQGSRSGDSMLEQESVRSPSPQRINGASGSLDVDVDGGSVHPRKRRRFN
jgi:hypothetical protein